MENGDMKKLAVVGKFIGVHNYMSASFEKYDRIIQLFIIGFFVCDKNVMGNSEIPIMIDGQKAIGKLQI